MANSAVIEKADFRRPTNFQRAEARVEGEEGALPVLFDVLFDARQWGAAGRRSKLDA